MPDLRVALGVEARGAFCAAFDHAQRTIDAEFFSIRDPSLISQLNAAAQRGVAVTVHVEGDADRYKHKGDHIPKRSHVQKTAQLYSHLFDPRVNVIVENDAQRLEHGKAAAIDDRLALLATANANAEGFACPGEVCVLDDAQPDVAAVRDAIRNEPRISERIIAGPAAPVRERIEQLLHSQHDLRIAVEDLSDRRVIDEIIARRDSGKHDEVIVKREPRSTRAGRLSLLELSSAGVATRSIGQTFMHDKYIDTGDSIYVGSANLTRNGLDEAREIGIIAPAADFGTGAAAMRADFDRMWSLAQPV